MRDRPPANAYIIRVTFTGVLFDRRKWPPDLGSGNGSFLAELRVWAERRNTLFGSALLTDPRIGQEVTGSRSHVIIITCLQSSDSCTARR